MRQVQIPTVHLVLRSHPPAPARVGLVPQPLSWRLAKTALALAFFWGMIPYVVWVPPHYPWPVLCFVTGAVLAYRWLNGRYVVRWFAGACPRCGALLRIPDGAHIDLPHVLTCFACHFEPTLETYTLADEEEIASDARGVRHVLAECAGTWREETVWDEPYIACTRCHARHHATPALLAAARDENDRGRLMEELAREGKFLT
jgi:hypothetical protein